MITAKLAAMVLLAHSPIWSVTIAPAKVAASPGQHYPVSVYDTGRIPIHIRIKLAEIKRVHGVCRVSPDHVSWATVSNPAFRLTPGHRKVVLVRITREGTPKGEHDLATEAISSITTRGASVRAVGAVASQALVTFPGQTHGKPCVALPAPTSGTGIPAWAIYLGLFFIAAAFALGLLGAILKRNRNRRGSHS